MIKITAISDLHGELPVLPGGDLLIIAGDCTTSDKTIQWFNFFAWLKRQEYQKKILIAGNHDNYLTILPYPTEDFKHDFDYLCDSGTEYKGLKIWGTPWSLTFDGINPRCTSFTGIEEELDKKFNLIPKDTNILISHSPPFGILDQIKCQSFGFQNNYEKSVGSVSLLNKTASLPKLTHHFFGHVHEKGGKKIKINNVMHFNCSIMNEDYDPVNKPRNLKIKI